MSFDKTDETRVAKTAVAIDYNHTLSFFNNRAGKYLERNPYAVTMYQDDNPDLVRERNAAEVEKLIPFLKLDDNSKVLDLACGVGRWADAVRGKALSYTGIDFSSEQIKIARSRCGTDYGCRFFTGSVIDFKRVLEHNRAGKCNRFLLIGILIYINDGDLYRVLNDIAECSDERAVVCIREPVGTKERLTLRDFYSRELKSAYNAIYRTKESIDEFLEQTLIKKGFTITHSDFLFENSKLNNRKETAQYFWILTRGMV